MSQIELVNSPDSRLVLAGILMLVTILSKYSQKKLSFKDFEFPLWGLSLATTIAYCLIIGFLEVIAVIALIFLLASAMLAVSAKNKILGFGAYICVILIFLSLGLHVLPGFQNQLMVEQVSIKSLSQPFSMYINFDKGLAGLIVFLVLIKRSATTLSNEVFLKATLISLATIIFTLSAALVLDIVDINLDYLLGTSFLIIFVVNQIMIVCLAEEVFFRGIIQERLYSVFRQDNAYYRAVPVGVTAIIFGVVHLAGGVHYMFVAMVAGLGYGLVYQVTRRVEFSIACHFLLNIIHLGVLSYPMK